jgi:CBS domain-containing protein
MEVREAMTELALAVGPGHTLRQAAKMMAERKVGAAVVIDPDAAGPAIFTERDLMYSIGQGEDPDTELVGEHLTHSVVYASPSWSLEQAASAMSSGGFRHLIVLDGGKLTGIISVRDIVRSWTGDGAACEVPAGSSTAG